MVLKDIKHHFVEGNPRISYKELGNGPPVIFLHGIGGNHSNWYDQQSYISDIGKEYIGISGIGQWYPRTGKRWSYALPLGPQIEKFNQKLAQKSKNNKIILGYPIEAKSIKKGGSIIRFITPVFQYIFMDLSFNPVNSK